MDLGNIVALEHVNVAVPDQQLATLFYVTGLGLTRDPYLMTGTKNMWVNVGRSQFHLPGGKPQVVEGDNRPGLGHAIAKAVGDAGINMSFVMAQVVGRKYSAVFGFENEVDASKAATLIKRATVRQEVVPRVRSE